MTFDRFGAEWFGAQTVVEVKAGGDTYYVYPNGSINPSKEMQTMEDRKQSEASLEESAPPFSADTPIPSGVEFLLDQSDIDARLTILRANPDVLSDGTLRDELKRLVAEDARRGVDRAFRAQGVETPSERIARESGI